MGIRTPQALRRAYRLKTRYQRLRARGLLRLTEIAAKLQVSTATVKIWRNHGLRHGHPYNDKNECLYEPPIEHPPSKQQGRKLANRQPSSQVVPQAANGVQYDA